MPAQTYGGVGTYAGGDTYGGLLAAIRTVIGNTLAGINGLTVYSRWPRSQPSFPCAIVVRTRTETEQNFGVGNLAMYSYDVHLLASLAGGYENAQDTLDPYLTESTSTGTVYGVLNANRTLGGLVHSLFVRGVREDDQVDITPDLAALGVTVELEVWATGVRP